MIKNNKKILKTLVFSLGLAFLTLTANHLNAQNDGSRGLFGLGKSSADYDYNYNNRDGLMNANINSNTGGIQNDDFGAPLGSGIAILLAAGAGYAVIRRKRSRKGTTLLLACVLLLGFTQCKKEQPLEPDTQGEKVNITLNVNGGNANGSRVEVIPPSVKFETGDRILVVSNGHYVGTLEATKVGDNVMFSGDITDPVVGEPLYFYFLGNNAVLGEANGEGNITDCTVNISDQANYPHLPVISMGVSIDRQHGNATANYSSEVSSYEAQLHNHCSLMKFNVITSSTAPICITGMNNKVTVDFSKIAETGTGLGESDTDNGFKYDKEGEGILKMTGGSSTERWVIVLPQAALEGTGEAFSDDNAYFGTRPVLSAITTDQYLNSGVSMTVNTPAWDGDLSKLTASSSERYATANNGVTITGTLAADVKVSIADGATVTLNGANINNNSKSGSSNFAGITCLGNATLNLEGGSIINCASAGYPGIQAGPSGNTLTIQGTGSLSAQGGSNAPGIGGGNEITCGNISLLGGQISACGGDNAPGLGCGQNGSCGNINISRNVEKITITGGNGASTSINTNYGGTLSIDDVPQVTYLFGDNGNALIYHPVNLSKLTSNYTAKNGDVMRGTLNNNVTISVNDNVPATITLSSANITYEGLVCVSPNVKFFLFGTNSVIANSNPGIQAPSSGTLTIDGSGSINVQSNAVGCAGIGGKINVNCGSINIKGGSITSCGGASGAGIGSGQNASCGNIEIEGGTISATGGSGAAGIGSGQGGTCGNINIEGGAVTANGGDGASNIGEGLGGSCGTITLPLPEIPEGALSGLFSVSSSKQVRFSRGNLQYIGSSDTPYWKFADNQRDYIGNSQGSSLADIDRDLFGWGTSGYDGKYPYNTNGITNSYYSGSDNISTTNYDWGVYNTISNATGQWRTLTIDEWDYLLENNTNGSSVVDGVAGWVIRPDGVTTGISSSYTEEEWATEEANGTVFLPAAGRRQRTSVEFVGRKLYYWSSSGISGNSRIAYCFTDSDDYIPNRYCGLSVRLVQDAN